MATLEQRTDSKGNKSWRAKIRLNGQPTVSKTFKRKTDANNWIQHTESAMRNDEYSGKAEATKHTVDELIDRYVEHFAHQKKSSRDQIRQLNWWKEEIGPFYLSKITPAVISECKEKLLTAKLGKGKSRSRGKTRSPSTVNRYMAAMSHVFTVAVKEWQWVEVNPFTRVSTLKEPGGRVRFLSDEERKSLLAACERDPVLYTIVVIALSTGARKGEIIGLRWSDVDINRGMITLDETKNGERRSLPLTGHALDQVIAIGKIRRLDTPLVFPSIKPEKPINIDRAFRSALEEAKIEDFRFHDLRHSAASYLAMNGASLAEIADVLGHKTLQMVKRYSHISDQHTASVVEKMNSKIFGAKTN